MPSTCIELLERRQHFAATFHVAPTGNDANTGDAATSAWRTIQKAFDAATPGSTVLVQAGIYREKLELNVSGNATDGPIQFVADGEAVISGRGVRGQNLIHITNQSYVSIEGFELRDNTGVRDGSGIRIEGSGDQIKLLNNNIHRIRGRNAMGITVYGTDAVAGVHNLTIDGNEISRCQAAPSEALAINGNVYDFSITNNYVHDVNNIGIVFIGGEGVSPDPATDRARQGICADNRVENARSNYGGGFAAGIYVDGGRDIIVERNTVTGSNLGIEVGCEHLDWTTENVIVRNNLLANNQKAGLGFGGYSVDVGRTINCTFTNNTIYQNGSKRRGGAGGEIWVQQGWGNIVENNIVIGAGRKPLLLNDENRQIQSPVNRFEHNLYFAAEPTKKAPFHADGFDFMTIADYAQTTGRDLTSLSADPLFANAGIDFNLAPGSPAIDAGDEAFTPATGELDHDGKPRLAGPRIDLGAFEAA